jgi:hypothetical protein
MKKLSGFLLLILLSLSVSGQRNADYGIFGGVSSYLGDINTKRLFYSPLPAGGILYRYNFNPRQSIRANIFAGGLRGYDIDFSNNFQQERKDYFRGFIAEGAIQFEFNFLPYSTQGKRWNYTPYLAAGAGIAFINVNSSIWDPVSNSYNPAENILTYQPVIPFSLGFKINISNIDPDHKAWLHNNDWYSFAGIAFTWKIYSRLSGCPAYDDVDESRRR